MYKYKVLETSRVWRIEYELVETQKGDYPPNFFVRLKLGGAIIAEGKRYLTRGNARKAMHKWMMSVQKYQDAMKGAI